MENILGCFLVWGVGMGLLTVYESIGVLMEQRVLFTYHTLHRRVFVRCPYSTWVWHCNEANVKVTQGSEMYMPYNNMCPYCVSDNTIFPHHCDSIWCDVWLRTRLFMYLCALIYMALCLCVYLMRLWRMRASINPTNVLYCLTFTTSL